MASQQTIFHLENCVTDAKNAIVYGQSCLDIELRNSGAVYPENRLVWENLCKESVALKNVLDDFIENMQKELA